MFRVSKVHYCVAACGVVAAIVYLAHWSWVFQRERRFESDIEQLVRLAAVPQEAEASAVFDLLRTFVHRHSRHQDDEEFRRIKREAHLMAEGLLAHARGEKSEPVHLECSTRSRLLLAMLHRLGYRTRTIYAFDTDANREGKLRSHTFVEVLNPTTGRWEAQDPDYNFYYRSVSSGERISVFETAEDPSGIEPCDGAKCGWDITSDEGKAATIIQNSLDIVSWVEKDANQRMSHFTSHADADRSFTFTDRRGRFCEIMAKLCGRTTGIGATRLAHY